jgi:hypothetical protein
MLVGGWPTPLTNMKVSWGYYSIYIHILWKIKNVPNHQPGNEMNILLVNPLGEMDMNIIPWHENHHQNQLDSVLMKKHNSSLHLYHQIWKTMVIQAEHFGTSTSQPIPRRGAAISVALDAHLHQDLEKRPEVLFGGEHQTCWFTQQTSESTKTIVMMGILETYWKPYSTNLWDPKLGHVSCLKYLKIICKWYKIANFPWLEVVVCGFDPLRQSSPFEESSHQITGKPSRLDLWFCHHPKFSSISYLHWLY